MEVFDKVTIEKWILPYLSLGQCGKDIKVEMSTLIDAILHKLKTGCQWRQLPVKQFFGDQKLTWQGVYFISTSGAKMGRGSEFGSMCCGLISDFWTCRAFSLMAPTHRPKMVARP
jgi:hypothetical protein